MDTNEILALYDQQERQQADYPGMRREVDDPVIRLVMEEEVEGYSIIPYSSLNEANADEIIAREIDYFANLKRSFEWTTFEHDSVVDLESRLAAHGFVGDESGSIMVLDLDKAPQELLAPVTADVERLHDPADLESVRKMLSTVWGIEFAWFIPRMTRFLALPQFISIYLARVDGDPACAAWVFFPENSQFAGLYGGSTVEQYRGQGLYTALVAARAQEAIRRGYRFLVIDAGEMSRPIVEKQGFRLLTKTTPYVMKFDE